MFVLNVKRCFNTKKEIFLFTYLRFALTGDGIALPKTLKKATAARWKSIFYVHYNNFCAQDYCDG